jgi:hypothetical protein
VKKAKKMDKLPEICEIVGNFISKLPEGDDILLKDSIERILNELTERGTPADGLQPPLT